METVWSCMRQRCTLDRTTRVAAGKGATATACRAEEGNRMPQLVLSLLGPFAVTLDGQPITTFESVKVRALLAYLAVEADRPA